MPESQNTSEYHQIGLEQLKYSKGFRDKSEKIKLQTEKQQEMFELGQKIELQKFESDITDDRLNKPFIESRQTDFEKNIFIKKQQQEKEEFNIRMANSKNEELQQAANKNIQSVENKIKDRPVNSLSESENWNMLRAIEEAVKSKQIDIPETALENLIINVGIRLGKTLKDEIKSGKLFDSVLEFTDKNSLGYESNTKILRENFINLLSIKIANCQDIYSRLSEVTTTIYPINFLHQLQPFQKNLEILKSQIESLNTSQTEKEIIKNFNRLFGKKSTYRPQSINRPTEAIDRILNQSR